MWWRAKPSDKEGVCSQTKPFFPMFIVFQPKCGVGRLRRVLVVGDWEIEFDRVFQWKLHLARAGNHLHRASERHKAVELW